MEQLLKQMGLENAAEKIEVADSIDFSKLVLTPEEGFLLSRIDAVQSLHEVLQISTFPKEVTLRMLEKFAQQKIIQPVKKKPVKSSTEFSHVKAQASRGRKPKESVPGLKEDFCLAIEDQFERLQNQKLTPFEVLEISAKASLAEAKKAYFSFTKKFHPDRVFRRESGSYGQWVEFIFRRLNQAIEEIEHGNKTVPVPEEKTSNPLKKPKIPSPIMDRVIRAREMLKEARTLASQDPIAAANALRLATTFDPSNKEIKELLAEVEGRANFRKAIKHFEEAQKYEDILAFEKAAESYEKAVQGDPKNVQYQRAFGEFLLYKMKDAKKAIMFSQKACELEPNSVDNHMLYAFNLKALQRIREAKNEFERVLQLDKSNLFAKNELAQLLKTSSSK